MNLIINNLYRNWTIISNSLIVNEGHIISICEQQHPIVALFIIERMY